MIIGIGTDIIEIERVKGAIERFGERFIKKIFSLDEELYCKEFTDPYPRFAARFAAKEAAIKALGFVLDHPVGWTHIMIQKEKGGRPSVCFTPPLAEELSGYELIVSLSHCRNYATAHALLYRKEETSYGT